MVGGALSVNLDKDNGIFNVLPVPGVKGRQKLETVAASEVIKKCSIEIEWVWRYIHREVVPQW